MENLAPVAAPRVTAWDRLADALGVPGKTPEALAEEAARRVKSRLPPGRVDDHGRIVQYGSPLEAAVDFRREFLERECDLAVSRHAAAVDDVKGAFGSQAAVDTAALVLAEFRRRVRIVNDLAPLAQRIALGEKLRDAEAELARTPRDPQRPPRHDPADVAIPAGVTSPEGAEYARKFAMREAAQTNALLNDGPAPYAMAVSAVSSAEGRIAAWDDAHPKLAALLYAQGLRARAGPAC